MNDKQEFIIAKLNEISDISQQLMDVAITGEDGNLREMSYHIKCYTKKIIVHLLHEWKNNEKFSKRKAEKIKDKNKQIEEEEKQIKEKIQKIFIKFERNE